MQPVQFQRTVEGSIRIHVLPTDRFKTYAVSMYIGRPLEETTVTSTAIIPFILRRGTAQYPETRAFRERLDELYGAGFGFDIYKRGNNQIVQFRMDTVDDRFMGQLKPSLLQETLAFLGQAITQPALENSKFLSKYVNAEKQTIQNKLESIVNDKIRYAAERCMQVMYGDDPFRFNPLGRLEDITSLESDRLYEQYRNWLKHAPIDLYVVGHTTLDEVVTIVKEQFQIERGELFDYRIEASLRTISEPKRVVEQLDVNQGKLNMGLSAPFIYGDANYSTAMVYNGILGGYPHSKLFTNVREKASLAYYASSRLDGYKGNLMIQSGIEIQNYERAVHIITEQLEALRSGQISDLELSQTKAMMTNQIKEMNDSPNEMIGFDFNTVLTGVERTASSVLTELNQVTKEQIQAVARKVELDTIYFLKNQEGE
ncbi:MAG: pitrilysin family protein [Paenibacillaceae bacterium]